MKETCVLIFGIGNLLQAVGGFGVSPLQAPNQQYRFPVHGQLMVAGTQRLWLVVYVRQTDVLIGFAAIDIGLFSGTLKAIRNEAGPKSPGAKNVSLCQTGFQEVLVTAEKPGKCPSQLLVIGGQPFDPEDYGDRSHPQLKTQIGPAIRVALSFLKNLGFIATQGHHQADQQQDLSVTGLAVNSCEIQCRHEV